MKICCHAADSRQITSWSLNTLRQSIATTCVWNWTIDEVTEITQGHARHSSIHTSWFRRSQTWMKSAWSAFKSDSLHALFCASSFYSLLFIRAFFLTIWRWWATAYCLLLLTIWRWRATVCCRLPFRPLHCKAGASILYPRTPPLHRYKSIHKKERIYR